MAKNQHLKWLDLLREQDYAVSVVTKIETLGYHSISDSEKSKLLEFMNASEVLPINDAVVESCINIRQQKKMELPDALIAATALVYNFTLWTHNAKDFRDIPGLKIFDPIA